MARLKAPNDHEHATAEGWWAEFGILLLFALIAWFAC